MYKLVIQDDEGKTTVVPLIRDELTIGRKEGNTIRLTERNVSRRHARLLRSNGSITIEDLNSYNGIRVNGARIQGRCQIRESDRVQIGDYLIEVKSEAHDKVDTLNERTVPMERVDVHAPTPVPEATSNGESQATTTRISKPEQAVPAAPFAGAVTEPMAPLAVADTDPGAPQAVTPVAHVGGHARLVVLSTNFAGREIELDKPTMVIGRTEENDICLNHRSISRHHAKIVRENGRHAIVDLQSSNGVRVNGEEYGKVELRRADVIDLGHVRMRFVEPGEDFVFGRDAHAMDVSTGGAPRVAVWIALALLVTGAVVALFLILGGDKNKDKDKGGGAAEIQNGGGGSGAGAGAGGGGAVTQNGGGTGLGTNPMPPPEVADAGAPVPTNPSVADEVAKQLDLAHKAAAAEKWADEQTAAKAALAADPTSAEAQKLLEQAQSEAANQALYKQFTRAAADKDYAQVAALFAKFDADSVYRVKAQPEHDRLKADYLHRVSVVGKRYADRGRCREQQKLARDAGRIWAEAEGAVMAHSCKEPVASGSGGSGGGGSSGGGSSGGGSNDGGGGSNDGGGGGTTAPAGPSYAQLIKDAHEAASSGHYGVALRTCEQALEKQPGDQEATMLCVIASCRLKSAVKARKYIRKLTSETRQQMGRQICLQEGVKDL